MANKRVTIVIVVIVYKKCVARIIIVHSTLTRAMSRRLSKSVPVHVFTRQNANFTKPAKTIGQAMCPSQN